MYGLNIETHCLYSIKSVFCLPLYRKRGGKLSPHPALRATLASEGHKGSEGQNTVHPHLAGTPSKGGQKGMSKSKSVIKIKK